MGTGVKRKLLNFGGGVMGFGFLGALDGIIFHQILQWHSVIMNTDRAHQIESDGFFHLAVTITLVIGGILLWAAGNPRDVTKGGRLLLGSFLMGGGIFNLLEGIINHHILKIHRVKPGDPDALLYDLGFLASGVILLVIGFLIKKMAQEERRYYTY